MKEKLFETKYNPRTKKFKQINLEKLSKESSDFVKHLNFVLSGTLYRICKIYEGKEELNVYATLFNRSEPGKEIKDYGILLTNNGISVGDWSKEKYFSEKYKEAIKEYNNL